MGDHWKFRKARPSLEARSIAEALLAERSAVSAKENIGETQSNIEIKFGHFILQEGLNLTFPEPAQTLVSIILHPAGRAELTYECLESILAYTSLPYELILIKTPDESGTSDLLIEKLKNVKILTLDREQHRGFFAGYNRAAGLASGEFLFFLRGDTRLTPSWAFLLVEGLSQNPIWGAVGVKLVHPQGKLLEAGNILWQDGTYRRYGGGDNPFKPEYSYVRQVDFCSPSCFLVRRELYRNLSGFDPLFESPFYGAADLGQRIRQRDAQVMYYPLVTVYRQESDPGTVSPSGGHITQDDRSKFMDRWGKHLSRRGTPIATPISKARDLRPGWRVLFIEDRIPAPPQGCGFPRSFTLVQYLVELGHIVTVLPTQNPTPWQPFTQTLERLGVETLYGRTGDWRRFFEERENGFDVVWVSRYPNLVGFFKWIKTFLPKAGLIFDSEALFSLRALEKLNMETTSHRRVREIQLRSGLQGEIQWMKKADLVITVSDREKRIIEAEGVQNIRIWPHAVPLTPLRNPFQGSSYSLFVGGFVAQESPDTAAILYFVKQRVSGFE